MCLNLALVYCTWQTNYQSPSRGPTGVQYWSKSNTIKQPFSTKYVAQVFGKCWQTLLNSHQMKVRCSVDNGAGITATGMDYSLYVNITMGIVRKLLQLLLFEQR